MTGITCVIPTIYRDSLNATIDSCHGFFLRVVDDSKLLRGGYGHPARNEGIDGATCEWVCSIDDDDVYLPGAFDTIQDAIQANPHADWFVFQMVGGAGSHFNGVTVPVLGHTLRLGNIGTPMLCWKRGTSRFGMRSHDEQGRDYGAGYFGDWEMAQALQAEYGDPVWINETIAVIRPRKEEATLAASSVG